MKSSSPPISHPNPKSALAYGRAFAHEFGSKLTLAHVVDLSVSSRYPANVVGLPLNEMRHDSAENLDRILNKLESTASSPGLNPSKRSTRPMPSSNFLKRWTPTS